jgi:preprotein translocase subunit SecF
MLIGLLVGTFTSLLIMPQLVVAWEERLPSRTRRI